MANGIQILPTVDKFAGLRQGALNFAQGLAQQQQQRSQAGELAQLARMIQSGGQIDPSRFQNPQIAQLALSQVIKQQTPLPGFSLNQGQTRFGAGGEQLASVPPAPLAAQPGFSLQPGGTRFTAGGAEIASVPAAPLKAGEQISQRKIEGIKVLEAKKQAGTITPAESKLLEKAVFGSGGINIDLSSGQLLTAATSLRNEFNTDQRVKDFRILAPKFKNMLSFIQRSRKTGQKGPTDIALSKTFQKLTDLMSSVREGEYETTFRGQNLLQKLRGGIEKLAEGGEGITAEFRQELVDTARLMFEDGKFFFNQAIEEKGTVADAFGIPRKQILGNIQAFDIKNTTAEFNDIFGTGSSSNIATTQGTAIPQGQPSRADLTEADLDNMTVEQLQSLRR